MENDKNKKFTFNTGANWKKETDKLKEKFTQLTDTDLQFETGKEIELLNRIEARLDKKREEVIDIMNKIREECAEDRKIGKAF